MPERLTNSIETKPLTQEQQQMFAWLFEATLAIFDYAARPGENVQIDTSYTENIESYNKALQAFQEMTGTPIVSRSIKEAIARRSDVQLTPRGVLTVEGFNDTFYGLRTDGVFSFTHVRSDDSNRLDFRVTYNKGTGEVIVKSRRSTPSIFLQLSTILFDEISGVIDRQQGQVRIPFGEPIKTFNGFHYNGIPREHPLIRRKSL